MAQFGSARRLGRRGPRFEPGYPDSPFTRRWCGRVRSRGSTGRAGDSYSSDCRFESCREHQYQPNSDVDGVWRSLVARFVRDEEALGSNPSTPTATTVCRCIASGTPGCGAVLVARRSGGPEATGSSPVSPTRSRTGEWLSRCFRDCTCLGRVCRVGAHHPGRAVLADGVTAWMASNPAWARSAVRLARLVHTEKVAGSNPAGPTTQHQMIPRSTTAVRLAVNQEVGGSNPSEGARFAAFGAIDAIREPEDPSRDRHSGSSDLHRRIAAAQRTK